VPALESQNAELARDGLCDMNGSRVGGLYADYQRGMEDAQQGKGVLMVATASTYPCRAKAAAEDSCASHELLDWLHGEPERRTAGGDWST